MKSLQGQLLVASPLLLDPNFVKTVVLCVQHNEESALGLVLNRPTDQTILEAWEEVSSKPCHRRDRLYVGGPCEGLLMAVHTRIAASEMEILPGVHFGAVASALEQLVVRNDNPVRFFVGYAGWTAGQLEEEMETGSWLATPASYQSIFEAEEKQDQWTAIITELARTMAASGLNPKRIPKDPSVN